MKTYKLEITIDDNGKNVTVEETPADCTAIEVIAFLEIQKAQWMRRLLDIKPAKKVKRDGKIYKFEKGYCDPDTDSIE